jgi:hypothetical protein
VLSANGARGGPCSTNGQMTCSGTGFNTCDNGSQVYRDCAPGTECHPFQGSILCDWPKNSPNFVDRGN